MPVHRALTRALTVLALTAGVLGWIPGAALAEPVPARTLAIAMGIADLPPGWCEDCG